MRPLRVALIAGLAVTAYGVALLLRAIAVYLDSPLAVSSTSGASAFYLADGTLGGYFPFAPGLEPLVIGAGLALIVGPLLVGALQPSSSATRASTAGSKADAHTR